MSSMIRGDDWTTSIVLDKKDNTQIQISVASKYVDRNIKLNVSAQGDSVSAAGGAFSNKSASVTASNLTLSSTDSGGLPITPSASATRNSVYYSSNVDGWITASQNDTLLLSAQDSWNGNTVYVDAATLAANTNFVMNYPGGQGVVKSINFVVDSQGNTTITGDIPGGTYTDADGVSY